MPRTNFSYALFYRDHIKGFAGEFVKRVVSSYLLTLAVSVMMLLLVDKLPLLDDPGVAIRRAIRCTSTSHQPTACTLPT